VDIYYNLCITTTDKKAYVLPSFKHRPPQKLLLGSRNDLSRFYEIYDEIENITAKIFEIENKKIDELTVGDINLFLRLKEIIVKMLSIMQHLPATGALLYFNSVLEIDGWKFISEEMTTEWILKKQKEGYEIKVIEF